MRYSAPLLVSLASLLPAIINGAAAFPKPYPGGPSYSNGPCISAADASNVALTFSSLLTAYSDAVADNLLADDFKDISESINFLISAPLDSVTFPSKDAFKAGQGQQPPIPSIDTLNVWNTCNTVFWRWRANMTPDQATGINAFELVYTGGSVGVDGWQIETNYSEFDVGSWLIDFGKTIS